MQLPSEIVLLLLAGLVVLTAAERQRFCYKRVGYTRKYAEKQHVQRDESCEGPSCVEQTPVIHYKTEVAYRTERQCCAGYQRAPETPDSCVPVCAAGCPAGEQCTAPNRCECAEGHERNSRGRCVAAAASLPGEEPTTLQSQILSYVSLLIDGVKSLGWSAGPRESNRIHAAGSVPFPSTQQESLASSARTEAGECSKDAVESCQAAVGGGFSRQALLPNSDCRNNGTGLENSLQRPCLSAGVLFQRWNNDSSSSDGRPLVASLVLGGQRFSAAQVR